MHHDKIDKRRFTINKEKMRAQYILRDAPSCTSAAMLPAFSIPHDNLLPPACGHYLRQVDIDKNCSIGNNQLIVAACIANITHSGNTQIGRCRFPAFYFPLFQTTRNLPHGMGSSYQEELNNNCQAMRARNLIADAKFSSVNILESSEEGRQPPNDYLPVIIICHV
jgi:hypothetical protein